MGSRHFVIEVTIPYGRAATSDAWTTVRFRADKMTRSWPNGSRSLTDYSDIHNTEACGSHGALNVHRQLYAYHTDSHRNGYKRN